MTQPKWMVRVDIDGLFGLAPGGRLLLHGPGVHSDQIHFRFIERLGKAVFLLIGSCRRSLQPQTLNTDWQNCVVF